MRAVLVLIVVLLLSSCGFHLRGLDLKTALESFYVTGDSRTFLRQELRQGLTQAGATESDSRGGADLIVELLDQRIERRSISTTGQARAAEYELELGVQFRLLRGAQELAAPQWLSRSRVYSVDANNIVGNSEEQALIERDMRAELVQSVVRTMNAVAQANPPPPSVTPNDAT